MTSVTLFFRLNSCEVLDPRGTNSEPQKKKKLRHAGKGNGTDGVADGLMIQFTQATKLRNVSFTQAIYIQNYEGESYFCLMQT